MSHTNSIRQHLPVRYGSTPPQPGPTKSGAFRSAGGGIGSSSKLRSNVVDSRRYHNNNDDSDNSSGVSNGDTSGGISASGACGHIGDRRETGFRRVETRASTPPPAAEQEEDERQHHRRRHRLVSHPGHRDSRRQGHEDAGGVAVEEDCYDDDFDDGGDDDFDDIAGDEKRQFGGHEDELDGDGRDRGCGARPAQQRQRRVRPLPPPSSSCESPSSPPRAASRAAATHTATVAINRHRLGRYGPAKYSLNAHAADIGAAGDVDAYFGRSRGRDASGGRGGFGGGTAPGTVVSARLAARLAEVEAKLASGVGAGNSGTVPLGEGGGGGGGVGGGGSPPCRGMVSGAAEGTGCATAENEVQSAALRHALLLEERGLQLERAEAMLRRKMEEESLMKSELQRLEEASAADREAWRHLADAEAEISLLQQKSAELDNIAKDAQGRLDKEGKARREDQERHELELQRLAKEVAAALEAASREGAAARSSRDLCEQMSAVCRQMRQAAEEAGARCADAEETARSVQAKLALAEAAERDARRESESLRGSLNKAEDRARSEASLLGGKLEAAEKEARLSAEALRGEKDATFELEGHLKDRDDRLERAARDAEALALESERCKEVCEGLRNALERSQREVEQLRARLQAAGDLAAQESARAKEALQTGKDTRSQLASCEAREGGLRAENAALAAKVEELHGTVTRLSGDLAEASKQCQDRAVDSEVLSRTAAEARRRAESLERSTGEARRAAEAAQLATVRAEASRAEAERALDDFRGWVGGALRGVEDALSDALRGVFGPGEDLGRCRVGEGGGAAGSERAVWLWQRERAGGDGVGLHSPRHGGRQQRWEQQQRGRFQAIHSCAGGGAVGCAARGVSGGETDRLDGGWSRFEAGQGPRPPAGAGEAEALMGRLECALFRIMRRIDDAKGLRDWVEHEVKTAREGAAEGLKEVRGRWAAELERLKKAEGKIIRLQEQAKYGGRRAALEAREECYAKIERVEKDKWSLRDQLVSEQREAEALRVLVGRLKDDLDKSAISIEMLEQQACVLQEKLSALSEQAVRLKAEELQQRQEKDNALANQQTLQSRLAQQERELEDQRGAAQEEAARADRLATLLEQEREKREQERILLEQDRASRETETNAQASRMLEDERIARVEETTRLTALLEKERRARREESALSEAVLKEVRETQGLLSEMSLSSCSGRPGAPPARAGSGERARVRPAFRTVADERSRVPGQACSSDFERQASALERIVADAAELVKHTDRFFDRYAETHKEIASGSGSVPKRPAIRGKAPGDLCGGEGSRDFSLAAVAVEAAGAGNTWGRYKPAHYSTVKTDFAQGRRQPAVLGDRNPAYGSSSSSSSSDCRVGINSGQTVAAATVGEEGRRWLAGVNPGNSLDHTLEQGMGEAAAAAVAAAAAAVGGRNVGPALRDLAQECYSLLETNAQLCVRLQGLGLEYARLARGVPAPSLGERLPAAGSCPRREALSVADLDGGDGDDSAESESGGQGRHHHHHRRRHHHNHQNRRCADLPPSFNELQSHHHHHRHIPHEDFGGDRRRHQYQPEPRYRGGSYRQQPRSPVATGEGSVNH